MIDRRTLLGLAPTAMLSCARSDGAYFGKTVFPKSRRLVHTLGGEIESLDPAKSTGSWEYYVIPALFEGLVHHHPNLPEPMAALAAHYDVSPDQTQFTFYLRGHRAPRGNRLANTDTLSLEYSRGISAPPDGVAAQWSDGTPITAEDFVYAWRRFVDPQTAAPMAYQSYCIANAEEVNNGKCDPRKLGVRALGDFILQVELRAPTPFFLNLITQYLFAAVPRRCIEAAQKRGLESSWTAPGNIITSGAFTLSDYRRYEQLVAVRNPNYYEAALVGVDELVFCPVAEGTAAVHLYKTGDAAATPAAGFPPVFIPLLRGKKDFHGATALGGIASSISATRSPFDNILLRYALNAATDKTAFSGLSYGSTPSKTIVPPVPYYHSPRTLTTLVDGRSLDVLTFNPEVARALLAKAGYSNGIGRDGRQLEVTYHFPVMPETRPKADIHREQWQRNLGVKVKLVAREFNEHFRMVLNADYTGVAEFSFLPTYLDPNPFLEPFATTQTGNPSGWSDPAYRSQFVEANSMIEPLQRMSKLAECETLLLKAMPIIPVYFPGFASLRKPFVRGLGSNLFDARPFKYVWIDMNWRPV